MIISTTLPERYQSAFTNGSFESIADIPLEKGGAGKGFGPHDLIEAALATCLTITVQSAAVKHNIPLKGVKCEVRIDRSVPDRVTLNYDLSFEGDLTAEQEAKLRDIASRCPVSKTLMGTVVVLSKSFA